MTAATIPARDLSRALTTAGRVTRKHSPIPILRAVRIKRDGDDLLVSGTDLDQEIHVRVTADLNGRHVEAILPDPGRFASTIKAAGADQITLDEPNDNSLAIEAGGLRLSLDRMFSSEEWPSEIAPTETDPMLSLTLSAEALRCLRRVSGAISTEETRYYLNGAYLHRVSDDGWDFRLVATDGHRLYEGTFPAPDASGPLPSGPGKGVIIPRAAVQNILSLAANGEPPRLRLLPAMRPNEQGVMLAVEDPNLARAVIDFGNARLVTKMIDGTFPDYQRVIPQSHKHMLTLDRAELRRAIDALRQLSSMSQLAVKWQFNPDGVSVLSASWVDVGGKGEFPVAYQGEPVAFGIGFNARYLVDILDAMAPSELVTGLFTDAASPTVFLAPDDDSFRAVAMPMRV